MALKARKDGYAYEQVSPDVFVRRQVFAGHDVPDGWYEDEEGNSPMQGDDAPRAGGLGAAPQAYKHQLDENGQIKDEELPAVEEAEAETAVPTSRGRAKSAS
jgi:hypothetical protein